MLMAVGIVLWLVAGIVSLAINAEAKIVWTCVIGAALGLVGIRYTLRRARRIGL